MMTEGWETYSLDQIASIKQGRYLGKDEMTLTPSSEKPVPVIGANGILGYTDAASYTHPIALVTCRGNGCGLIQWTSVPSWVSNNAMALDGKPGFDNSFIRYMALNTDFSDVTTGSAQPQITMGNLSKKRFSVPPLNEQRRIAGVLGALDDLIEVNRGLMDHLRSLITAVYQQMVNKMKPPDKPIFDVFEIDFGAAFKGSAFSEPGVGLPLLRIRDLKTFSPGTWTTERVKGDVIVSAGDVVVGMDAEFRPTFWIGPESLLNQRVCRVRSRVGGNAFVRESLVKPLAFIEGHKTGTTVSHLNKADLLEVSIPVPDATALAQFDEISEPLLKALVLLSQEIDELVAARDELLPLLMSGRVRVAEAGVAA